MRHNQNRRSRGRSRKGPNPLTRSYESNGPDVKVRGTAAHVAEKYSTLARDALSSGDTVAAEAYFQHAEHYNRIVATAQAQAQMQNQPQPGSPQSGRGGEDDGAQRSGFNGNGENGGRGEWSGGDAGEAGTSENVEATSASPKSGNDEASGDDAGKPVSRARKNGSADAADEQQTAPASKPNGRRPRRKKADIVAAAAPEADAGDADADKKPAGDEDKTQDGSAALAAFPD